MRWGPQCVIGIMVGSRWQWGNSAGANTRRQTFIEKGRGGAHQPRMWCMYVFHRGSQKLTRRWRSVGPTLIWAWAERSSKLHICHQQYWKIWWRNCTIWWRNGRFWWENLTGWWKNCTLCVDILFNVHFGKKLSNKSCLSCEKIYKYKVCGWGQLPTRCALKLPEQNPGRLSLKRDQWGGGQTCLECQCVTWGIPDGGWGQVNPLWFLWNREDQASTHYPQQEDWSIDKF